MHSCTASSIIEFVRVERVQTRFNELSLGINDPTFFRVFFTFKGSILISDKLIIFITPKCLPSGHARLRRSRIRVDAMSGLCIVIDQCDVV